MIPLSDTHSGFNPDPTRATGAQALQVDLGRFVKSSYANLWRDRFSGTYHCRAKVAGQPLRQSLKTKSKIIAKARLDDLIKATRAARLASKDQPEVDGFTVQGLFKEFEAELARTKKLKPRSKVYRQSTLKIIRKSWPRLEGLRPRAVTVQAVQEWAARLERLNYSPGRFNSTVDSLRMIFARAVKKHLIAQNPVVLAEVEKLPVTSKDKVLPEDVGFARVLRRLKAVKSRRQSYCFVRVLAYSGQRPESVRLLRPPDIDLVEGIVHWPPVKHNKRSNPQPMHRQLRVVLRELLRSHPGGNHRPLVPIKYPRRALAAACVEAGVAPVFTPGMFRHFFTTKALEANIPVSDVAAMRGDKDGGAMLLRTYVHPRLENLRTQIRKM